MSTPTDDKIRPLPEGYPEVCADIVAQVESCLKGEGMAPDRAYSIAFKAAEHVRSHWSGALIYFAKGAHFEALQWQKEMYAKFNGTNHEQLAREYEVSVQYVYQIVKAMNAAEKARRQGKLF